MTTKNFTVLLLGLTLCFSLAAASGANSTATSSGGGTVSAEPSAAKATRVVFVGKEQACDCTRKSIDAGWTALQNALGTPASLPVEKLQIDTDEAKVAPYRRQKPILALPAIYFVDGKDAVLELLQGELTEAQVAAVLKK